MFRSQEDRTGSTNPVLMDRDFDYAAALATAVAFLAQLKRNSARLPMPMAK
jgi:hypothetical protein